MTDAAASSPPFARLPDPAPALARLVAASLNHLLAAEPAARQKLQPHAGKTVRVQGALPLALGWRVDGDALLSPDAADAPDLTLQVQLSRALQALAEGRDAAGAVTIDGDADFAAAIGWLAANLRWEFEEDLARVFGDAAAHRIGRVVRNVGGNLQQAARDTEAMLRRGFAEPEAPLVGQAAFADFRQAVIDLRDAAARLEKRVELLEGRTE
jgi:ubiquinone biosynthesis protein UbiJ